MVSCLLGRDAVGVAVEAGNFSAWLGRTVVGGLIAAEWSEGGWRVFLSAFGLLAFFEVGDRLLELGGWRASSSGFNQRKPMARRGGRRVVEHEAEGSLMVAGCLSSSRVGERGVGVRAPNRSRGKSRIPRPGR